MTWLKSMSSEVDRASSSACRAMALSGTLMSAIIARSCALLFDAMPFVVVPESLGNANEPSHPAEIDRRRASWHRQGKAGLHGRRIIALSAPASRCTVALTTLRFHVHGAY
jgi:hypothetical protein